MSTSLIYRSPAVYEAVMLALYGRFYHARSRTIAALVPDGAQVLELCCGPANLYRRHLKQKSVSYHGLDINPGFIKHLIKLGATGQVADLQLLQTLPPADYVIMQASLYHFLPDPSSIVDRMLNAARKQVIIAEPIRNLSSSGIPILSKLARRHTDPGSGAHQQRFTPDSLDQFFSRYANKVARSFLIPGGREKVYVLATS
ncbi:MAG TPA: class I SAM-dependent methyltransferase [Tepidisphaeraceae bacterium]|jgi:trans-aconitate methyltransferase